MKTSREEGLSEEENRRGWAMDLFINITIHFHRVYVLEGQG